LAGLRVVFFALFLFDVYPVLYDAAVLRRAEVVLYVDSEGPDDMTTAGALRFSVFGACFVATDFGCSTTAGDVIGARVVAGLAFWLSGFRRGAGY